MTKDTVSDTHVGLQRQKSDENIQGTLPLKCKL